MRRRGSLAVRCLVACGVMAVALAAGELPSSWSHWSHFRTVEIEALEAEEGQLVRVPVPDELFRAAETDLADVRVIDASGAEIGYVVYSPGERRETVWRDTRASEQGFVPGRYSQIVLDTQVDDEGDRGALHDAVRLSLPEDTDELFVWVEIASSPGDPEAGGDVGGGDPTWRIVRRRAPLYRFTARPSEQGLTLRYARTRDRWLRLRFLDGDSEITVSRARVGELFDEPAQLDPFPARLVSDPAAPAGESWYRPPETLTRLPISGLAVRTARDAFHRPVEVWVSDDAESWRQVGSGQIYRYGPFREGSFAGEPPVEEAGDSGTDDLADLEVTFRETAAPWWRVVILDRDDPPIEDLQVDLLVRRRQIVFRPSGIAPYRLIYGNSRAEVPEYELASLTRPEALAGARPARLGPEERNETWTSGEPFTERHPVLLWLALGLVILVLATMALRTLRG